MSCIEKTPHNELMRVNSTRGFQKQERMWKMTNDLAVQ